jgi:hypothetical protein
LSAIGKKGVARCKFSHEAGAGEKWRRKRQNTFEATTFAGHPRLPFFSNLLNFFNFFWFYLSWAGVIGVRGGVRGSAWGGEEHKTHINDHEAAQGEGDVRRLLAQNNLEQLNK